MSAEITLGPEVLELVGKIRERILKTAGAIAICIDPYNWQPVNFVHLDARGHPRHGGATLFIRDSDDREKLEKQCLRLREILPRAFAYTYGAAAVSELREQYGVEYCGVSGIHVLAAVG